MNNLLRKLLDDRLAQDFFTRETTKVAHDLLGKLLVSYHNKILLVGKIVETEAYRSDDPASHT
jgi:DNA-3-methyladenine glycosylase